MVWKFNPYLLNLCDIFLTLHALSNGGVELNPLMRSIPVMVVWKVLGVGVLCVLLNHFREATKLAQWGLILCAVVYTVLLFYHFYFIGGMHL